MKEEFYDDSFDEKDEEQIDYKALFFNYLIHWHWFVISALVCLIGAFVYLKFATPVYNVAASVIIKENDKKSGPNNLGALEDLGFFSATNNFDNEVEIFRSRTLIRKVVQELDLYIHYTDVSRLKSRPIYQESPVRVWITPEEASRLPKGNAQLTLNLEENGSINVQATIDEEEFSKQITQLPALLSTPYGTFSFSRGDSTALKAQHPITELRVSVSSPYQVAKAYAASLSVEPTSKTTTIAQLSLKDTHIRRGMDFLNKLVEIYNRDANDDKNQVAEKTAEFISDRIAIINTELGSTERELESFKRGAKLTDLKSDAQIALTQNSEYEKKNAENITQLRLVQFLSEYAHNPSNEFEVIPVNVGLADQSLSGLIVSYNEMLLEYKRLLRSASVDNPAVVNLQGSIKAMRQNVLTTIASVQKGLLITKADLERQARKYAVRITDAPSQERQFVSITRQQSIQAELYLMLLQKREENAITLAATANNARIVDEALADNAPVSPKGKLIYLVALVLGLGFPVGLLYVLDLLKFKVEGRNDVEKLTRATIVGDVPHCTEMPEHGGIVIKENSNDVMAETFRNIRTNVLFSLPEGKQVIMTTSTTSGEGKSFCSGNLATSLALMGKKVIIVGLDIRKPGLNKVFSLSRRLEGITSFLSDPDHTNLLELVQPSQITPNLSVLPGGIIPPNPTELVAREALDKAINILKQHYDYIVLDTAPIGMVTDTQIISRCADLCVYICRADFTHKSDFQLVNELIREKKLPSLCVLINDLDMSQKKYGYYYGYGKYGKYYGYGKRYGYGYGYGTAEEKKK